MGFSNSKLYKYWFNKIIMEMIKVPKAKFEKMRNELEELKKIDFELLSQFRKSLEDVKTGRIRRVA